MNLAPHHFQAQASYFDSIIHFTASSLWAFPIGLAGLDLDAEALRNGTVSLIHARGMFADGLAFHMPEYDPLPEPRRIADIFPPTNHQLNVSLAVPRRRPGAANCALNPGSDRAAFRFIAEQRTFPDDMTGQDEKPVGVARKNIQFHIETDPPKEAELLPLARVVRDAAGGFVYDDSFVPPCVDISASPRLMQIAQRLVSTLQEKSTILHTVVRGTGGYQAGLSATQVASFWFLHALNSALPGLSHLCSVRHGHPCALFLEMSRLGGALCTFGLDSHPRDLPAYDHFNLEDCFQRIEAHIQANLETIIPTNCIRIPLQPVSNYFFEAPIADERCMGAARWILAIRSAIGESDLIRQTPQLIKVCSSKFVAELMRRALPGMTLTHLPMPPAAISPRADWQYFSIDRSGPCWDHLRKTRHCGIYAPGQIPSPELELLILLDSQAAL